MCVCLCAVRALDANFRAFFVVVAAVVAVIDVWLTKGCWPDWIYLYTHAHTAVCRPTAAAVVVTFVCARHKACHTHTHSTKENTKEHNKIIKWNYNIEIICPMNQFLNVATPQQFDIENVFIVSERMYMLPFCFISAFVSIQFDFCIQSWKQETHACVCVWQKSLTFRSVALVCTQSEPQFSRSVGIRLFFYNQCNDNTRCL